MKLLVTGGAGFIGSNFILYWLREYPDDTIVNFDTLTYAGNLTNLAAVEKNPRYTFVKADIRDAEAVRQAMKGVEAVVHFAAESHVDRSILEPGLFLQTNVLGTQVLLEAAREAGVHRFHQVSTDEVFGSLELGSQDKFSELTPFAPNSPYSASKAGADFLVRAYYHTYGLPVTISHCSNNYGSFQFPEKLIPLMTINALTGKPLPVYGDGANVRDWIQVEDHARAIDLIINKGKPGEVYCVGGEAERSNLQVVRAILAILGKSESCIEYVKDRLGHDRRYAIDNRKIREELGYQPAYDFETGLAKTVQWYQENQAWWEAVITQEYRKYYQKQYGG